MKGKGACESSGTNSLLGGKTKGPKRRTKGVNVVYKGQKKRGESFRLKRDQGPGTSQRGRGKRPVSLGNDFFQQGKSERRNSERPISHEKRTEK